MGTPVQGMYYSDLAVGEKEDVSPDLIEAIPSQTPYLNTIGFDSMGSVDSLAHSYYDDARVDLRNTLNGAINAGATTIVLAVADCQPRELYECEAELIRLGTNPSGDGVTWVGCARSVGAVAAAAHATGTPIINLGKAQAQGSTVDDAGTVWEPRLKMAYVQEVTETIQVPFSANRIRLHGRDEGTAYDRQVRQKLALMKLKAEQIMLKGFGIAAVPTTSTAGAINGLIEAVIGTNTTACGGSDFTQTFLRDAVEDIALYYDPVLGMNATLLTPIRQMFIFDGWQQAHVEVGPSDPLIQTYGTHVRRLQVGPMLIDCIPYQRQHNSAVLYQGQYIKPLQYSPIEHRKLGLTKIAEEGLLYAAIAVENNVPEAHYTFTGLRDA